MITGYAISGRTSLYACAAPWLTIGVLIVACDRQPAPSNVSPPKEAVPQGQVHLPEYYGSYAVDQGKTLELTESKTVDVSANAEFIVFHKAIAIALASDSVKLSRVEYDINSDRLMVSNRIDCRMKPIEANPEMVRLVPAYDLAPGLYIITGDHQLRFRAEGTRYRESLLEATHTAIKSNEFEKAVKNAATAYAVFNDAETQTVLHEARFLDARSTAVAASFQYRWDDATVFGNKALVYKPKDAEMEEFVRSIPFRRASRSAQVAFEQQKWEEAVLEAEKALLLQPGDNGMQKVLEQVPRLPLLGHPARKSITSIRFASTYGTLLTSEQGEGTLRYWNLASRKCERTTGQLPGALAQGGFAVSRTGQVLVSFLPMVQICVLAKMTVQTVYDYPNGTAVRRGAFMRIG